MQVLTLYMTLHVRMRNMYTWIRSAIVVIAIALVGIVGVWQAGNLVAERGTLGPSVLQSISPTVALFALVITIGVGALAGGRFCHLCNGYAIRRGNRIYYK